MFDPNEKRADVYMQSVAEAGSCNACRGDDDHDMVWCIQVGGAMKIELRLCERHAADVVNAIGVRPEQDRIVRESADAVFAECSTFGELERLRKELKSEDDVLQRAIARRKVFNELQRKHERRISAELNAPYKDEMKRWRKGDKVYFGKSDNRSGLFDDRIRKLYNIEAGKWCRVYSVHPRKGYVWLCRPGAVANRKNIIDHAFTVTDLRHADVSRTEPELRSSPDLRRTHP